MIMGKTTIEDIRKFCGLCGIPSKTLMNSGIVLDYRLSNALESLDFSYRNRRYDFDVYLPEYGVNLQRPYVWDVCQGAAFIMNVLLEKPLDEFVVVEHEGESSTKTIWVIDGKQRLTTVHRFLNDGFPIGVGGREVCYSGFSDELKVFFRSRVNSFNASVYYSDWADPMSDDVKILLFNYYNFSGTPQTKEHKDMLAGLLSRGAAVVYHSPNNDSQD